MPAMVCSSDTCLHVWSLMCVWCRLCSQWSRAYCVSVRSSSFSTTGQRSSHNVWLNCVTETRQWLVLPSSLSSDCSGTSWHQHIVQQKKLSLFTC